MKLLIADDERDISDALGIIFRHNKYECDIVYDGEAAYHAASANAYDAMILDIMMPKMDGIEVLTRIRKEGNVTPVLLLTAKADVEDRILGLDVGADDYLAKPFDMRELISRINVMTRRRNEYEQTLLHFGNVTLNEKEDELFNNTTALRITKKETQMMAYFMNNANKVIEETMLAERFWQEEKPEKGSIALYIGYLRNKLHSIKSDADILSEPGGGYCLRKVR